MRYHLKYCASVVVTEIETNKVYDMYLIDICYAGRKQKKTKQVAKSGILEKLYRYYEFSSFLYMYDSFSLFLFISVCCGVWFVNMAQFPT